jgi:chromate transporter
MSRFPRAEEASEGSPAEVFAAFLKLGLTSFGGPIAHLGYFHRELVGRRGWVDDARYAQLVALCQFLPGPASSQLGFALGMIRAGWRGATAAFLAFTLPSAILLLVFAALMSMLDSPLGRAAIHGLKLLAVAVVAQGLLQMARRLTPDVTRALIAVGAAALVIVSPTAGAQLLAVAAAAVLGLLFCRYVVEASSPAFLAVSYGPRTGAWLIGLFSVLLIVAFAVKYVDAPLAAVAGAFYRTGALVFGGGHVVVPLLEQSVVQPGWVPRDEFLAGYGAAQAVPGPMFSIAAFLGARLEGAQGGVVGAALALAAIFLPGLLLVAGALPLWQRIARNKGAVSALAGVNAGVVGLLAAALYDPVWVSAIVSFAEFAIAVVAFTLLAATRTSVLLVLGWCVLASLAWYRLA